MTPAKFGYKVVFSREGVIQPPVYAYFPDFVAREEIAQVVWRHAESLLRNQGVALNQEPIDVTVEQRLESRGYKIVSYKRLNDAEGGP